MSCRRGTHRALILLGVVLLVARLPPEQAPVEGQALGLTLRAPEVLFFDPASGERLAG